MLEEHLSKWDTVIIVQEIFCCRRAAGFKVQGCVCVCACTELRNNLKAHLYVFLFCNK